MDPGILVPPKGYGGIERLVETFAIQYQRMGHEVHLLVTTGSYVAGCTMYPFGKQGFPPRKSDARKALFTAWQFLWQHRHDFDLVHNFGRLAYLLPLLRYPVKKIMTYQREIHNRNIWMINWVKPKNLLFTACSADLLSRIEGHGNWQVVYNAIHFAKYTVTTTLPPNAPLIFLGRIERVKGCHTAIKLAKATGERLIIAGNVSPLQEEIDYFEQEIKPLIDGVQIRYVGALDDEQKNHYLGQAKALVFPIEWQEPFGIVMIEAMACGTPVIGYQMGSVAEVIEEGITGFKVRDFEGMVKAVENLHLVDREQCGLEAKKRFDAAVIARQYLQADSTANQAIVIVTTGQPAANPRVVKEYEALQQAGYSVKVLYTYSAEWSFMIDEEKFNTGQLNRQDFILVGGNPFTEKYAYFFSRVFNKILRILALVFPFFYLKKISFVRSSFSLWQAARQYKGAIYIAHYLGALPAAMRAARLHSGKVIFDAEDFHRGEIPYYDGQIADVVQLENQLLPRVNLLTTASPLISKTYQQLYPSLKVSTINNVFSKKFLQPIRSGNPEVLKLFWFSQNIGPNRGLETIVAALNELSENITLTLLGNIRNKVYTNQLLAAAHRPESIVLLDPVKPEAIFEIAAGYDIGIAGEIPHSDNRDICLTNKIFTYLQAGNCILASDTLAQKALLEEYPTIGFLYKHNNPAALAVRLKEVFYNRELLIACKYSAHSLAAEKLNWEQESEKLSGIVKKMVTNNN